MQKTLSVHRHPSPSTLPRRRANPHAADLSYAQDPGDEVRANKTPLPPSPGDAHLLLHVMLMCFCHFVHALSPKMLHCLALPILSHA